jgi:hypothetical protein
MTNFLNALDECLLKEEQDHHHPLLRPFAGEFHSKVTCPHCEVQSETNDVFMQLTLPLK